MGILFETNKRHRQTDKGREIGTQMDKQRGRQAEEKDRQVEGETDQQTPVAEV